MNVNTFLQELELSGLLERAAAEAVMDELDLGLGADGKALARELVTRELLTAFQASAILKGAARAMRIGEYQVLDRIGKGGMGEVYKAQHRLMKRTVALKTLQREAARNPRVVQRFYHEVQTAAKLQHPNIVTAHDAGEDKQSGAVYLITEYVDGLDLAAVIKQRGAVPVDQAVNVTIQAAQGLAFAHARGVIHRDIKPGNLLINREGVVKVLDMGLARLTEDGEAPRTNGPITGSSGRLMGTVAYMAPEHAADPQNADARSDIYSLGCTMYRMLTGKPPYKGETALDTVAIHRDEPIPVLSAAVADLPLGLQQIFEQMVAKDPAERYQSMEQVIADLRSVVPQAAQARLLPDEEMEAEAVEVAASLSAEIGPLAAPAEDASGSSWIPVVQANGAAGVAPTRPARPGAAPVDDEALRERALERRRRMGQATGGGGAMKWIVAGCGMLAVLAIVLVMLLAGGGDGAGGADPDEGGKTEPTVEWVDVLATVDPARDTTEGRFVDAGRAIRLAGFDKARAIVLPIVPTGSYELHLRFLRDDGDSGLTLGLPVGDRFATIHLGRGAADSTRRWSGIEQLNGLSSIDATNPTHTTAFAIRDKTPHALVATVQRTGDQAAITVSVDGAAVIEYAGPAAALPERAVARRFTLPGVRRPLVATQRGTFEFSALKIKAAEDELPREPADRSAIAVLDGPDVPDGPTLPDPPTATRAPFEPRDQGPWLDVLGRMDAAAALSGAWSWRGESLVAQRGDAAMLPTPIAPRGGYELEGEFTMPEGEQFLVFVLPVGRARCALVLAGPSARYSGLCTIDGQGLISENPTTTDTRLTPGSRHRLSVRIDPGAPRPPAVGEPPAGAARANATIEAKLDGGDLLSWSGPASALELESDWSAAPRGAITVATRDAALALHELRMRRMRSARPPVAGAWVDLVAITDPSADAIAGQWNIADGVLRCAAERRAAALSLPAKVEGGYDLRVEVDDAGEGFALMLPVGERMIMARLETGGVLQRSGLGPIDGEPPHSPRNPTSTARAVLPRDGARHTIEAHVRDEGGEADIEIVVDGEVALAWHGSTTALAPGGPRTAPIGDRRDRPTLLLRGGGLALASASARAAGGRVTPIREPGAVTPQPPVVEEPQLKPDPNFKRAEGEAIDLLAKVNLTIDAISGEWWPHPGGGIVPVDTERDRSPALRIPARPGGAYELELLITPRERRARSRSTVTLPVGDRAVDLVLGLRDGRCALEQVAGRAVRGGADDASGEFPFELGQQHSVVVRVVPEGERVTITAHVDRVKVLAWTGEIAALDVPASDHRTIDRITLHNDGVQVVYHAIKVTMIEGKLQALR